eukprot:8437897-Alexandrium_andersonii.AAC.1
MCIRDRSTRGTARPGQREIALGRPAPNGGRHAGLAHAVQLPDDVPIALPGRERIEIAEADRVSASRDVDRRDVPRGRRMGLDQVPKRGDQDGGAAGPAI